MSQWGRREGSSSQPWIFMKRSFLDFRGVGSYEFGTYEIRTYEFRTYDPRTYDPRTYDPARLDSRRIHIILPYFTIFDCFCQENLIDKSRHKTYFSSFLFSRTSILNCFTFMIHSVLHFLQNRGKCFNSVSSISFTRVFFPQTGHFIH